MIVIDVTGSVTYMSRYVGQMFTTEWQNVLVSPSKQFE
jgi:hypothetical protein